MYLRSEVTIADICDGTTNTYLVGEKYLNTASYENAADAADNTNFYQGYDWDVNRWGKTTNALPAQDTPTVASIASFGSSHAGVFLMSFCDRSSPAIWRASVATRRRQLPNLLTRFGEIDRRAHACVSRTFSHVDGSAGRWFRSRKTTQKCALDT